MTKKSLARLERDRQAKEQAHQDAESKNELDEFFQNNTAWTDIDEVYMSIANQIAGLYGTVLTAYNEPSVIANLDPAKFAESKALLRGLSSDVDVFTKELVALRENHKDKMGGAKTVEDFQMTVLIFEKYQELQVRFEGTTGRTIQHLIEEAAAASGRARTAVEQQVTKIMSEGTTEEKEALQEIAKEVVVEAVTTPLTLEAAAAQAEKEQAANPNVITDVVVKNLQV